MSDRCKTCKFGEWGEPQYSCRVISNRGKFPCPAHDDGKEAERQGEELEQMRVQMAGVSVAAMGGTNDPAKRGEYGWSVAYQDTLELRLKYNILLGRQAEFKTAVRELLDAIHAYSVDQDQWEEMTKKSFAVESMLKEK